MGGQVKYAPVGVEEAVVDEGVQLQTLTASELGMPDDDEDEGTTVEAPQGPHSNIGGATLSSCVVSLINSMIGAGVLGYPGAFSGVGFVLGIWLLVLCASMNALGVHLLTCLGHSVPLPSSIGKIADEVKRPWLRPVFEMGTVFNSLGGCIGYLMICAELMSTVCTTMGFPKPLHSEVGWCVGALALVTPMAYAPSLDALKFTSSLAIVFVLYVTVLVLLYGLPNVGPAPCDGWDHEANGQCPGPTEPFIFGLGTLKSLCVFMFGFCCHPNAFDTTHNELSDPTMKRANTVTLLSYAGASCSYFIVSIAGYAAYGSQVAPDVLATFPGNSVAVNVGRICVSGLVLVSYPMLAQPAVRSLQSLLASVLNKFSFCAGKERNVMTAVWLLGTFSVAVGAGDLSTALGLAGATGSVTVGLVVPGFAYMKMFPEPHLKRTLAKSVCGIGCVMGPAAVLVLLLT